jgi:hypothetical protein
MFINFLQHHFFEGKKSYIFEVPALCSCNRSNVEANIKLNILFLYAAILQVKSENKFKILAAKIYFVV